MKGEGYPEEIQQLLTTLLVEDDVTQDLPNGAKRSRLADRLPLLKIEYNIHRITVQLLCVQRQGAIQFFYEMTSQWLVSSKKVRVEQFFSSEIEIEPLFEGHLLIARITIALENAAQLKQVQERASSILAELRLGVLSSYHASKILSFKTLSSEHRVLMIQDKISNLIRKRSESAGQGILEQMRHFLVTCREDFLNKREYGHISQIISSLYAHRELLQRRVEAMPDRRHIAVKIFRGQMGGKSVLSVLAAANILHEKELIDEGHLKRTLKRCVEKTRIVPHSSFSRSEGKIRVNYVEIEKEDGSEFSLSEIRLLREQLPEYLGEFVGQWNHPIVMPRNDEEILRNIVALSKQVHTIDNIPQITISFDEQKDSILGFTMAVLRVVGPKTPEIRQVLAKLDPSLTFHVERVRCCGHLDVQHYKEAVIIRMSMAQGPFLRPDCSVDLYRARETCLKEITRLLGEVRDYNGGMLGKQKEALGAVQRSLRKVLGRHADRHTLFLEQVFHAVTPVELRNALSPEMLQQLFLLFLEMRGREQSFPRALYRKNKEGFLVALSPLDKGQKKQIHKALDELAIPSHRFSLCFLENPNMGGVVLKDPQGKEWESLCHILDEAGFTVRKSQDTRSRSFCSLK